MWTRQLSQIDLGQIGSLKLGFWTLILTLSWGLNPLRLNAQQRLLPIPYLESKPQVDGDLSDWKDMAFSDGWWDLRRMEHTPWYLARRNRLTLHQDETASADEDLRAQYYLAWDETYLYMGAEVHDNRNDVTDEQNRPKAWYARDGVAWFFEAPADGINEEFGEGNHAFCFIADDSYPEHGAWWRHGSPDTTYLEDQLPAEAVSYRVRMNPWGKNPADYIIEARVELASTLGVGNPDWHPPRLGDLYRLMIVHCDPDGGAYGGHLLLYGQDDQDAGWGWLQLTGPRVAPTRLDH